MDLNSLTELLGEKTTITLSGLVIGLLFGVCAQRSRFCMRSAVVEFWNRQGTGKLAVWLFAFSAAIVATQLFISQNWLDVSQARQLSAQGSLSGALIGGLLFGISIDGDCRQGLFILFIRSQGMPPTEKCRKNGCSDWQHFLKRRLCLDRRGSPNPMHRGDFLALDHKQSCFKSDWLAG